MGNSASSGRGHHEETVDFGYLTPQGIYTGPRDWNQAIVSQLIIDRKLAPFYRPLEDYDESWDDEQILAARKEPPEVDGGEPSRAESVSSSSTRGHAKRPSAVKEPGRNPEAAIYRGAVECPICFLVRQDGCILPWAHPLTRVRSTTRRTSITRDVATKPSARNASCKLSGRTPPRHI